MKNGPRAPQAEIEKLFCQGRKLDYKKGEIIQRANETPRGVYFLAKGFVKEYTLGKDGTEHITGLYERGELFSVQWAYLGVNQNLYREAYSDVEVWRISAETMKHATQEDPKFMQEVFMMTMWQKHLLKIRVENLAFNNAYDKVAYRLLYMAGRFGVRQNDGWFVTVPFRHQYVADSLSITRETASRMIERIQRQGLVSQDGKGHFIIRDPSALARTIGVEESLITWPHLVDGSSDKDH